MNIVSPIWTEKGLFHNYGIDEFGNIYNTSNPDKIKKLHWKINENGYANICLRKDGKNHYFKIHRLVAMNFMVTIFIGGKTIDVNHIDGNKLNNHISNLEWCTRSHNLKHAYDLQLKVAHPSLGTKNGNSKFSDEEVICILDEYYNKNKSVTLIADKHKCSKSFIQHLSSEKIRKEIVKKFKKDNGILT